MDSFFRNSFNTYLTSYISLGLNAVLNIGIAKYFGPTIIGKYYILLTFSGVMASLGNFGLVIANIHFSDQDGIKLGEVVGNNFISFIILTIFLGGIYFGLYFLLGNVFKLIELNIFTISFFIIPTILLQSLFNSILISKRLFNITNSLIVIYPILFGLFIVFIYREISVSTILLSYISANLIILLINIIFVFRILKDRISINFNLLKKFLKYGIKGNIGNWLNFFNYRMDYFIINYFLSPVMVGLYGIATSFSEILLKLPQSIGFVLFPTISADKRYGFEFTSFLSRIVFIITLLFSLGLIIAFKILLAYFLPKYSESFTPFLFLLPGIFALSIANIISHDLVGRGYSEVGTYGTIGGVVVTLIGNIIIVPLLKINGAAIVSSISYITITLIIFLFFRKKSNLDLKDLVIIRKEDINWIKSVIKVKLGNRISKNYIKNF